MSPVLLTSISEGRFSVVVLPSTECVGHVVPLISTIALKSSETPGGILRIYSSESQVLSTCQDIHVFFLQDT